MPTLVTSGVPTSMTAGARSATITVTLTDAVFNGTDWVSLADRAGLATFTPSVGDAGSEVVEVVPANGATSFTFTVTAAGGDVPLIEIEISNGQGWTGPDGLSITVVLPAVAANRQGLRLGLSLGL